MNISNEQVTNVYNIIEYLLNSLLNVSFNALLSLYTAESSSFRPPA